LLETPSCSPSRPKSGTPSRVPNVLVQLRARLEEAKRPPDSTRFIALDHLVAFTAVIDDPIKPFLAKKGHNSADVGNMHRAWCRSAQLRLALWAQPYTDTSLTPNEW
jgi:hypothetical protein